MDQATIMTNGIQSPVNGRLRASRSRLVFGFKFAIALGGLVFAPLVCMKFIPRKFLMLATLTTLPAVLLPLGCSLDTTNSSTGELDTLRFQYRESACVFGCSLERPVLQGSAVVIEARGGDVNVRRHARLANSTVGRIESQQESCYCEANGNARGVELSGLCPASETKTCRISVQIETLAAGDAKLEIVDAEERVMDRIAVNVRSAVRMETRVKSDASVSGGRYEVRRGKEIALECRAFTADGKELIVGRHGVSHQYADKSVMQPGGIDILGSSDVEIMTASKVGETVVTARVAGAEQQVRFRVVP
jgi:hypothetical protein